MFCKFALHTIGICLLVELFGCLGLDGRMLPKSEPEPVKIFNKDAARRLAAGGGSSVRSDEARTLNPSKLDSWELITKDNAGRPSTDDRNDPSYSYNWYDIRQIHLPEPFTLRGSSRVFIRTLTFWFGDFTIRMQILILLGAAIVMVSIVGMFLLY